MNKNARPLVLQGKKLERMFSAAAWSWGSKRPLAVSEYSMPWNKSRVRMYGTLR